MSTRRTVRVGLIGYGQLGRAIVTLLSSRAAKVGAADYEFQLTMVASRSKGLLVDPDGLGPGALKIYEGGSPEAPSVGALPQFLADRASPVDVVVEASSPSREPGSPAEGYIRAALHGRKDVVTANKGPIAWAGRELVTLAHLNGVAVRYEATLMSCLPAQALRETFLPLATVKSFCAIVNATSNFLLSEMAIGKSFEDSLEGARKLGIVEQDATDDTDGWDSALKATILHNLLFNSVAAISPREVARSTFQDLDPNWPRRAASAGNCVRSVARGKPGERVTVAFEEFGPHDLPSLFGGSSMFLQLDTDLAGRMCMGLLAPTVQQSAYAVLIDLLTIAGKATELIAQPVQQRGVFAR